MSAGVDVVNLDLNADSIADPLDAALQDVTNIQFSADLLQIDASAFIGESGVARDHEELVVARQIAAEVRGHRIGKRLKLPISS